MKRNVLVFVLLLFVRVAGGTLGASAADFQYVVCRGTIQSNGSPQDDGFLVNLKGGTFSYYQTYFFTYPNPRIETVELLKGRVLKTIQSEKLSDYQFELEKVNWFYTQFNFTKIGFRDGTGYFTDPNGTPVKIQNCRAEYDPVR